MSFHQSDSPIPRSDCASRSQGRLAKHELGKKEALARAPRLTGKGPQALEAICPQLCRQASDNERAADAAANASQKVKVAQLYAGRIGERDTGIVSRISDLGAFVRLDATGAEGLIRMNALGTEWWDFDDVRLTLTGDSTGTKVGLGCRVVVEVASVNVLRGHLDLKLLHVERVGVVVDFGLSGGASHPSAPCATLRFRLYQGGHHGNPIAAHDIDYAENLLAEGELETAAVLLEELASEAGEYADAACIATDARQWLSFSSPFEYLAYRRVERDPRELSQVEAPFDRLYADLAYIYIQRHEYESARDALKQAVRWNPMNCAHRLNLAEVFRALGDTQEWAALSASVLDRATTPQALALLSPTLVSISLRARTWPLLRAAVAPRFAPAMPMPLQPLSPRSSIRSIPSSASFRTRL